MLLSVGFGAKALCLFAIYPLQIARLAVRGKRTKRENWWHAIALVLCKFPQMLGQLRFLKDKLRRAQSGLIEYK